MTEKLSIRILSRLPAICNKSIPRTVITTPPIQLAILSNTVLKTVRIFFRQFQLARCPLICESSYCSFFITLGHLTEEQPIRKQECLYLVSNGNHHVKLKTTVNLSKKQIKDLIIKMPKLFFYLFKIYLLISAKQS